MPVSGQTSLMANLFYPMVNCDKAKAFVCVPLKQSAEGGYASRLHVMTFSF